MCSTKALTCKISFRSDSEDRKSGRDVKKVILSISLGKHSMNRIPWFSANPKHDGQLADIEKKFGLRFKGTLSFYLGWAWRKSRPTRKWPLQTKWWQCQLWRKTKVKEQQWNKLLDCASSVKVIRVRLTVNQTYFYNVYRSTENVGAQFWIVTSYVNYFYSKYNILHSFRRSSR